jgi:hypothetical protein
MSKIKILYIARGGRISGSQRQLLNLLHRIDRSVYEPVVICSEGGDMADKLAQMHIETHVYPRFFGWRVPCYMLHRYYLKSSLMRQCAELKIDLIHCSYLWYSQYSLFLAGQ